jgi:hypothetical protein
VKALIVGENPTVEVPYAVETVRDMTIRVSLFDEPPLNGEWVATAARHAAADVMYHNLVFYHQRVILLGDRVAAAFGVADEPYYTWFDFETPWGDEVYMILMPNPSPTNRIMDDEESRFRFQTALVGAILE